MPKKLLKEYDVEVPGGRGVRFARVRIYQGKFGYWGLWEADGQIGSTERWYQSSRDAEVQVGLAAERALR